ncbi:double-cubane-cluster-containing anaerobic reductase [Lentisphaerota bacterium WC36G]|nr:2-hydroxyacyl-CoA dehydratase family protein [Lentisphaerae bacterium WC36]
MLKKNTKNKEKNERLENRLDLHLSMTVREIFEEIDCEMARPKNMNYFDNFFKNFATKEKNIINNPNKKKIIGYFCMSVPEELIYAADAIPVRLCAGSADSAEIGESYFPEVSCPMVKSAVGFASTSVLGIYQQCDLVIIPATCDWKIKLAEILKEFIPVAILDIPRVKNCENSKQFWFNEIVKLKKIIEKNTKKKITKKRLLNAINLIHHAQYEFKRLQKIRKSNIHTISGRDAGAVINAYFYDNAESWTQAMKNLNDELEQRIKEKVSIVPNSSPRVLLTGSPFVFPNWKIPNLIESSGGALVCDEICTSNRYLNDMVAIDEKSMVDLINAVADRYLQPCSCPVFSNNDDRKNKLLNMINEYNIEGVIYHVFKGCHPYDTELRSIEKMLADRGISQLKIETDYNPEDKEQLRTRIEAFLETLKGRRYSK